MTFHQTYKNYRIFLNNLIRTRKQEYFREQPATKETRVNTKDLWKTVRNVTGRFTKKTDIIEIKDTQGKIIPHLKDIANVFNEHYHNIGKLLAEKIKPVTNFDYPNKFTSMASAYLAPTTEQRITKIINTMRTEISLGPDDTTTEVLKSAEDVLALHLAKLFNLVIEQGTWPDTLKSTVVTAINKPGDKTELLSYRPISIISDIGKA